VPLVGVLVAVVGFGAGSPPPPPRAEAELNPTGYSSARLCGRCHTDIYESWKKSLHAFSLSDPIFDTAFMQAIKAEGEPARRLCLRCHAPMTLANGDYELRQGVTREGVSCDFCHTVTAVRLDHAEQPYLTEVGLVKRSILRKAASPAHQVAYSELHGTAEFCGGCHTYTAASGAPIMSTFDEWREGPYSREGVQCQDCHMVRGAGKVVGAEIRSGSSPMHLHDLIHDSDQVRSALAVRIVRAERRAETLAVDVEVENVGSGHKVPTGIPSRVIVLTVTAESDGRSQSAERRYQKVVGDAQGKVLSQDFEALLYGAKILTDNRIGPREKRREHFSFDLPRQRGVTVKASLSYHYSPMILDQSRVLIRLGEAERKVY